MPKGYGYDKKGKGKHLKSKDDYKKNNKKKKSK